ncbi:MAG: ferritin-like domain-containing protein [Actinomycetota bacterium]|nr:ferritin-like domain-containing protein [Thermoleophilaceae bacterium]MDQ3434184.1 ferritin-like domain-containing protein [Actinomycetota bacterium]
MSTRRIEAGELELGGGLEVLLAAALEGMPAGGRLEVITPSRSTALELPSWARGVGHEAVSERPVPGGSFAVEIERGPFDRVLAEALRGGRPGPPLRDGAFHTADLRALADVLPEADAAAGFTPLGATAERGAPAFRWTLNQRDALWADDVAELTEQASAAQWDASRDIPWEAARGLPDFIERAVSQVMTFIAQNEYAALYVPAGFLADVNPAYPEMLMWLASHVHDEARHVEVFTKRSLIGGQPSYALASTELSLHTLLDERDFSGAALLLNVLGEGTFLDLLRFVEHHAPDAATRAAAALAHRDEVRHVHFGISHVRRHIATDPDQTAALIGAAERRATKLTETSGLSPLLTEGLTVMAAGSLQPAELARGATEVRELMQTMEDNRIKRLRAAGFDGRDAQHLSDLHTPNLM